MIKGHFHFGSSLFLGSAYATDYATHNNSNHRRAINKQACENGLKQNKKKSPDFTVKSVKIRTLAE